MKKTSSSPIDAPDIQNEVDSILSSLPTETETAVTLPSKGKFYGDACPDGIVKIRPLKFEDEKALLSVKDKNADPVGLILGRCVEGVSPQSLVMMDKFFLVMKIREISYGDEYLVESQCGQCGVKNPLQFILSQLEVKYIPEDFTDPQEVDLPGLGKKAKVRLPRVHDESYMAHASIMMDNLWRWVVEIDGNSKSTVISKVIPHLPSSDIHTIVKKLTSSDYGIETKARFTCDSCAAVNDISIPITENFFSVN
tara:strand:+ start:92 stop:850 length:759 start_codon:yes stop_codon:yes gene_type:complete